MSEYLGEFDVNLNDTPYADYEPSDWALEYITMYGQIDGSHHKDWVLDQVVRILKGTNVIVKEARWSDGFSEYRIELDEPSEEYEEFIEEYENDGEYSWDTGIAP